MYESNVTSGIQIAQACLTRTTLSVYYYDYRAGGARAAGCLGRQRPVYRAAGGVAGGGGGGFIRWAMGGVAGRRDASWGWG